jgi:hypothetical protein
MNEATHVLIIIAMLHGQINVYATPFEDEWACAEKLWVLEQDPHPDVIAMYCSADAIQT